jgi:hypothetical protein
VAWKATHFNIRFVIFNHHLGNLEAILAGTQTPSVSAITIKQIITSFITSVAIFMVNSSHSSLLLNRPPSQIESLNSSTIFRSIQLKPVLSNQPPNLANCSHKVPFKNETVFRYFILFATDGIILSIISSRACLPSGEDNNSYLFKNEISSSSLCSFARTSLYLSSNRHLQLFLNSLSFSSISLLSDSIFLNIFSHTFLKSEYSH